jgi:hypothetical protein
MTKKRGRGGDVDISEELERILRSDYLGDLSKKSTAEIREMRRACEREEHGLSYARRIVQGKLDIVRAEAIRRRDETGTTSLLAALPSILGDRTTARPRNTRAVRLIPPPDVLPHVEVAESIGDTTVASIREQPDGKIADLARRLADAERELSVMRQTVFERIDAMQAELTDRYKTGAADVREVLRG